MRVGIATDHGGFSLKEELLVQTFLDAECSQAERHLRRLANVASMENPR